MGFGNKYSPVVGWIGLRNPVGKDVHYHVRLAWIIGDKVDCEIMLAIHA